MESHTAWQYLLKCCHSAGNGTAIDGIWVLVMMAIPPCDWRYDPLELAIFLEGGWYPIYRSQPALAHFFRNPSAALGAIRVSCKSMAWISDGSALAKAKTESILFGNEVTLRVTTRNAGGPSPGYPKQGEKTKKRINCSNCLLQKHGLNSRCWAKWQA